MTITKLPIRLLAILCSLVLLSLFSETRCAYACSCAFDETLTAAERAVANSTYSDVVFMGEAINSVKVGENVYFTFVVDSVFKGELAPEFTVSTYKDGAGCGDNFVIGSSYLIFAHSSAVTDSCSGNLQSPSADILTALGTSNAPTVDGSTGATINIIESLPNTVPTIFIILAVALLFLLILFGIMRLVTQSD